jgi:hypothetical protein
VYTGAEAQGMATLPPVQANKHLILKAFFTSESQLIHIQGNIATFLFKASTVLAL